MEPVYSKVLTGSGAIDTQYDPTPQGGGQIARLHSLEFHLEAAGTGTLTISKVSPRGTAFNTVFFTKDMSAAQDGFEAFVVPWPLERGDQIKVTWPQAAVSHGIIIRHIIT